ncbi:MAG TPA: carboxypeptidase-like regulatory domain-containing protein [Longimicrobiales bacterium]|nr:carboxypeptidase-like regulatory domain-containing protein [Longimicrobiales bacterium]
MRSAPPVAPFIVLAAACFGASEPLASDTGAVVEVSLWPIDPVEFAGQPSRTRPAVDAHVVVLDDEGREVADETTGADGTARILLAPGSYTMRVDECPGAMSGPSEDAAVVVSAGAFATVALTCDTGIR